MKKKKIIIAVSILLAILVGALNVHNYLEEEHRKAKIAEAQRLAAEEQQRQEAFREAVNTQLQEMSGIWSFTLMPNKQVYYIDFYEPGRCRSTYRELDDGSVSRKTDGSVCISYLPSGCTNSVYLDVTLNRQTFKSEDQFSISICRSTRNLEDKKYTGVLKNISISHKEELEWAKFLLDGSKIDMNSTYDDNSDLYARIAQTIPIIDGVAPIIIDKYTKHEERKPYNLEPVDNKGKLNYYENVIAFFKISEDYLIYYLKDDNIFSSYTSGPTPYTIRDSLTGEILNTGGGNREDYKCKHMTLWFSTNIGYLTTYYESYGVDRYSKNPVNYSDDWDTYFVPVYKLHGRDLEHNEDALQIVEIDTKNHHAIKVHYPWKSEGDEQMRIIE